MNDCECDINFEMTTVNFPNFPQDVREALKTRQEINWCKNLLSLAKVRLDDKFPMISEILYLEALGYYECNLTKVTEGSS